MILSPVQRALIYISGANLIVGSPTMSPIISNYFSEIMRYDNMVRTLYGSIYIGIGTLEEFVSALARHIYIYTPHGRVTFVLTA